MKMLLRALAGALLLSVAACGEQASQAPAANLPSDPSAQVRVALPTSHLSPDWIVVARQRDCPIAGQMSSSEGCPYGQVMYNQHMITRSVDGSVANMWVQTDHGAPQLFEGETETREITIRYTRSRVHYRFRCEEDTFAIVERQIVGDADAVLHREFPPEIFRSPVRWSPVSILMPIACEGGSLQP
jgi:hypothetical protein